MVQFSLPCKGRFTHSMPFPCRTHAVPLPRRAAKGLECAFPIWFTQCGRVWFTLAMPCPCYAPTMPFFSRPQHSVAVERRPRCAVAFPGGKERPGVTLNPHPLPVPWSWKGIDLPLLPLWAVRPVQSLSACTGVHFTLFYLWYLSSKSHSHFQTTVNLIWLQELQIPTTVILYEGL